jgi:hypothetical protein
VIAVPLWETQARAFDHAHTDDPATLVGKPKHSGDSCGDGHQYRPATNTGRSLGESKSEGYLAEKSHEWAAHSGLCTISAAEIHVYTIFTKSNYCSNFRSALSQHFDIVFSDAFEIHNLTLSHEEASIFSFRFH